jgi:hypothetical protein
MTLFLLVWLWIFLFPFFWYNRRNLIERNGNFMSHHVGVNLVNALFFGYIYCAVFTLTSETGGRSAGQSRTFCRGHYFRYALSWPVMPVKESPLIPEQIAARAALSPRNVRWLLSVGLMALPAWLLYAGFFYGLRVLCNDNGSLFLLVMLAFYFVTALPLVNIIIRFPTGAALGLLWALWAPVVNRALPGQVKQ